MSRKKRFQTLLSHRSPDEIEKAAFLSNKQLLEEGWLPGEITELRRSQWKKFSKYAKGADQEEDAAREA